MRAAERLHGGALAAAWFRHRHTPPPSPNTHTDVSLGEHVALVDGFRMAGIDGGIVRPAIGLEDPGTSSPTSPEHSTT